jgi:prepilin-type N-terminal cleavage/methylation domain-containing protein
MNKSKGFTIIELIVVIAIIAVLAAIVMVNVTQYINKSKDAAIKGNMATIMTNAAVYFDTNGNYTAFCGTTGATLAMTAADNAWGTGGTAAICVPNATGTAFCACKQEKVDTTKVFCIDSSGAKKEVVSTCAAECVAATALCL